MPVVLIGCRLPHGLTISHPNPDFNAKATIAGIHSSKLVKRDGTPAAEYVTTPVDQELWDAFKTAYKDYRPLKTGAIFEAKSEQEARAKAAEMKKEKTGLEPLDPSDPKHGVKKADKKE